MERNVEADGLTQSSTGHAEHCGVQVLLSASPPSRQSKTEYAVSGRGTERDSPAKDEGNARIALCGSRSASVSSWNQRAGRCGRCGHVLFIRPRRPSLPEEVLTSIMGSLTVHFKSPACQRRSGRLQEGQDAHIFRQQQGSGLLPADSRQQRIPSGPTGAAERTSLASGRRSSPKPPTPSSCPRQSSMRASPCRPCHTGLRRRQRSGRLLIRRSSWLRGWKGEEFVQKSASEMKDASDQARQPQSLFRDRLNLGLILLGGALHEPIRCRLQVPE